MGFFTKIGLMLGLSQIVLGISLPLSTSSRWIVDSSNQRVKLRCVNWAGHMETHLPEGLHKQSIEFLSDWIANQGFNCVRLTYSIDHALNPSLRVSDAFTQAAGPAGVSVANMTSLHNAAILKNPFLANANTTTRDVYDKVIDTLYSRGVMTILDNHVSRASWCCNINDGNGWWSNASGYIALNSQYFDTSNWLAGLQSMALWAKASHPGVVGMSLRNEIRQFLAQGLNGPWDDWYNFVTQGAMAVHTAHPDVLVIVGGVSSATDLSTVRSRQLDFSEWSDKHVWEFHAYSFSVTFPVMFGSCAITKQEYGALDGFVLQQGKPYTAPLILSEFGVGMTGGDTSSGLSSSEQSYLNCLVDYISGNDADWAVWALQGTYYVRNGQIDFDESYGLLKADWSGWRNPGFPAMLGKMWNVTQGP